MKAATVDEIKSYVRISGCTLLFLYFFANYVMTFYRIEGKSMNPLLDHGQRVVSNRLSYKTSPIQRGDVVVFTAPSETRKTFIKRIIGLPGELIRIDKGKIFIEGKQLDDSYVPLEYLTTEDLKQLRIPLGHYFVVGDHRNVSNDSRLWTKQTGSFPFVPERYIKGKIIFRIWPPTQIGPVESISPEEMLPTAI